MRRYTLLAGTLRINIAGNRLKVRVGDDDSMSIALPPTIDPGRLSDDGALSWAVLAAVPFAGKVVGHKLPEDVRQALQVVAEFAMYGEDRSHVG